MSGGGGGKKGGRDLSEFNYGAMSRLVVNQDRSVLRTDEPTGAPESLVGRINVRDMGSRVRREPPKELDKKKSKGKITSADEVERSIRRAQEKSTARFGAADVLESVAQMEGLRYRPRTTETREVYELLLGLVHQILGDQTQEVVRSAADTVLESLKSEDLKEFDKRKEVESVLGNLPEETWNQLVNLGKKVTDYGEEEDHPVGEGEERAVDGEGVAVLFEDEEDDEDDEQEFEVKGRDSEEESDEEDDEDEDEESEAGSAPAEDADEALVLGRETKRKKTDSDRVSPHDIDAFWLQRLISASYPDPVQSADFTTQALEYLGSEAELRDLENSLAEMFGYENFDLVATLTKNREVIVWCTKLARSNDDEKQDVEVAMREKGVGWILRELRGNRKRAEQETSEPTVPTKANLAPGSVAQPRRVIDIDSLTFSEGGHLMSRKKVKLPEGSFKRQAKGYEEIHVPEPKRREAGPKDWMPLSKMPDWTQPVWASVRATQLNPIQSKVYPIAFETSEPMLICAPTGAGKTNCAALAMLRTIGQFRDPDTGYIDRDSFKIIYVSPMKALVQEQVAAFSKRFKDLGINVAELTGDSQLTKQQIAETQIIVTTPEKWDVITRKSTDTSYTNLVRLMIVDEIHLLHDDRGPVLESIISRAIRRMDQTHDEIRIVGLSATLPNYKDVAAFLRVDVKKGLFFFDATYRPVGLKQQFIGVTEKKAIKRLQTINEVCYEKVLNQAGKSQTIVFVHSRKETAKTAKFLRDMAMEKETLTQFINPEGASREVLLHEANESKDFNLKDILPFGFGIHHAGMSKEDRATVEELFLDGHIQVLCSTATLAWGVNLPAHTVIIKGTQVYNPEKGKWSELSPQDVLQMLGRAGRPQFDTYGEGIIITNHGELQYYTSLMNQQLPIESQFVSKMVDNLNAEIVLGTVRNRDEGVAWLGYTYLYVRMVGSPGLYNVGADYMEGDPTLVQKRADLIHSAAVLLEKGGLIRYDRTTGVFQSTDLGRIASHYYVAYSSMAVYNKHLKPNLNMIDLFRVFALSNEFKLIPVRQEEKLELAKLLERVPIPVKEGVDEPVAKINVLLQAYISQLKLSGFDIVTDMVFIQQSAGRILRAMFEICLKKGWAAPMRAALDLCKMVERRMWKTMTPLRQFPRIRSEIVTKAERKDFPWYRYFDLDAAELGELIGLPKSGQLIESLVHKFPRLDIQAHVLPLTRSLLKINVTVTPDFVWDYEIHGASQAFWIIVEDVDGERILYHDQFILRQRFAQDEHYITITVPISDPVPPNYYISIISDRWLQAESRLPVSFQHLIRPEPFPPHTPLLDLQLQPVTALHNKAFENLYPFESFNKIQTQVFQALYTTDESVFVGAPTGSGKTVCAELALLRLWSKKDPPRAVCIEPYQEMVDARVSEWSEKFTNLNKEVVALTGESTADLALLRKADIVVCTPAQWDLLSRRWKTRKDVQTIGLLIADELQLIGGDVGSTYEVIVSRTRYVSQQTGEPTRIVACSVSLSNARDLGDWIGASSQTIFNFSPSTRPLPLEVHLQSFNVPHFPSLMLQMAKPAYLAMTEHAAGRPTICFVASRKQCKLTANDILSYCLADEDEGRFLNVEPDELAPHLEKLQDQDLAETLKYGIGYYHEALSKLDKRIVTALFEEGAIKVLVASKDTAWSLPVTSYMVVIMGVQSFDGQEHRYVDYAIADILQMMGRACRPSIDTSSRCVLMCQQTRKDFFKKFLNEALPVESSLPNYLHDHFNAEIVAKTIENKQEAVDWCTWTWFYRRLMQNPGFYNLQGTTPTHVADYLSESVETTLNDLAASECIIIQDEMDTLPNNLGMIASFYYISYITVETFSASIKETTKLKGLLEIVSSAHEFETVPIRHHEDTLLERIYGRVPVKLAKVDYNSPYFKTFLLLQAHFSRMTLPPDLAIDQAAILGKVTGLLSACVDVMSSKSYLGCLGAMDLSQMCVQAIWDRDSPLRQVPYFDDEVLQRFKAKGLDSVYDIMELEDDERNDLLRMNDRQLARVAKFVNSYPNVEVTYSVEDADSLNSSEPVTINVSLDREMDEENPDDQVADAPHYPHKKMVSWWLVVGDASSKQLYAIKKVTVKAKLETKLDFNLSQGQHKLKLYLICDSYSGADQDFDLEPLKVVEGESSDEEDSDEEMDQD
ncbi:Sec63 Brl domain-domain-containing protein [Kockovaella imperatae]|uniref:RNA helicase n=1 Tax=Kockovaella imperatae TaxID=4999 RepID=A0A1Y1UF33_9TREE|nr:Sec63 Brl domain-domain-containing protein [Kockovaella imperatae]ORX36116.1 Sec63 Brl domain-domain-containing protein [Kockovaella imperatae]